MKYFKQGSPQLPNNISVFRAVPLHPTIPEIAVDEMECTEEVSLEALHWHAVFPNRQVWSSLAELLCLRKKPQETKGAGSAAETPRLLITERCQAPETFQLVNDSLYISSIPQIRKHH